MKIIAKNEQETLALQVIGRLDTLTSNQLEAEMKKIDNGVKTLVLDFTELEYITSVGIRILISANKMMTRQGGKLILHGLNEEVSEVLEITGVLELFCVE
ncbi:MAG: STAS domain-containing protein [Christensenella sp.]|nr:STAS domain-containing protein [Christensenella sp.]